MMYLCRSDCGVSPQRIYLLDQPPLGLEPFRVGDPGIVEELELLAGAPDRRHDRAAPCLSWMRREHGVDFEPRDEVLQLFRAEPPSKMSHGGRDRLGHRIGAAVAVSEHAGTVVLLRQ